MIFPSAPLCRGTAEYVTASFVRRVAIRLLSHRLIAIPFKLAICSDINLHRLRVKLCMLLFILYFRCIHDNYQNYIMIPIMEFANLSICEFNSWNMSFMLQFIEWKCGFIHVPKSDCGYLIYQKLSFDGIAGEILVKF